MDGGLNEGCSNGSSEEILYVKTYLRGRTNDLSY